MYRWPGVSRDLRRGLRRTPKVMVGQSLASYVASDADQDELNPAEQFTFEEREQAPYQWLKVVTLRLAPTALPLLIVRLFPHGPAPG